MKNPFGCSFLLKKESLFLISSLLIFISFGQENDKLKSIHELSNSNPDSAIILYNQYLSKTTDSLKYAKAIDGMANAFQFKSELDTAITLYFIALEICERNDYRHEIASIQNNLGSLYMTIEDYDRARKFLTQALTLFTQLKDTVWITKSTINLAGVDFLTGEPQKSLEKLRISAKLAKASNNYRSEGGTYSNISIVYNSLGQLDSAIIYIDRGLQILEKLGDTRAIAISLKEKANMLADAKKYQLARESYHEMQLKSLEMNYKLGIYESFLLLARMEKLVGNIEIAYELMSSAIQWKDSVLNENNLKVVNELTAKYETEKKDSEIALLTKESSLRKSERNLSIVIGASILISLTLVSYLYYQNRKANSQLTEKNKVITKALSENKLLIKEIHHRVKNNLQIVSSLLSIQTNFLEDEKSSQAITDIQSRVLSMAMVHQNLYQRDTVTSVQASEYLGNLVSSLKKTFDDPDSPFQFDLDIDTIIIPADQAVNIGLISNEIITNALKHAFPQTFERNKEIKLSFKKHQSDLKLVISDNGVGIKEDIKNVQNSYGWKMIESLTKSMRGSVSVANKIGTTIYITLPSIENGTNNNS